MSEDEKPVTEQDMMNMFASVWVKVEVKDSEGEEEKGAPKNTRSSETPRRNKKRKHSRKYTKTLKCDLCDYTTVYKNCLELHVMGHNQEKPFACTLCNYTTKYPTSLHRHLIIKHQIQDDETSSKAPIYKCDQCEYTTYYKWNLNSHKRKHSEKNLKCPHCPYETAYKNNFIKHSKVHRPNITFKCDKCPFETRFEGHITQHLSKIHNEVTEKAFKCDLCDFATIVKWRLNVHKQRSKREDPIVCPDCTFTTNFTCALKRHKITHYSELYVLSKNLVPLPMSEENKGVQNEPIAPMQYKSTDDTIQYKPDNIIPYNNYTYGPHDETTDRPAYKYDPETVEWDNIKVLESDDKERPFLCYMCTYTSKFKAAVQRHYQRHHTGSNNRPYKCMNCDFSTKTKDQISLHNKRSLSNTDLFCKTCGFITKFKCQFVMHQKCHYDFKCHVCNYSCKHKHELQKHFSITHMGNALKCRFCDYRAARKDSILCHETIHTGVKPFKCSYCTYTSVRKCLLDNHVKRYHSEIKKDITVVSDSKIQSLKVFTPSVPTNEGYTVSSSQV